MRPQPEVVSSAALILLAVTGLYGTGFWLFEDEGPTRDQIFSAADRLCTEHRADDLIFLVPSYATRARERLGDLEPLAVKDPLLEDFAIHPRAWVFGLFGEAEKLRPRMLAAGHTLEKTIAEGEITIDLYRTYADRTTTYRFRDHLPAARVYHEKQEGNAACDQWMQANGQGASEGRWSCPYDKEWFYVAPEWHRMGDHPRRCLWAHPPTQGRLVITYPNVPLTGQLFGRAGHTLNSRHHARAPIHFDVTVGSSAPQRFIFELEDHFKPFLVKTATTGTATVTFAVSTPDAGANHFCFDVEMRK